MKTDRPDDYRIGDIRKTLRAHQPRAQPLGDSTQHAAVAIILRKSRRGHLETLLIQRVERPQDPWSGHMAFPGGRMEPHEESLESVARRETLEEIGLELSVEMQLGRLDDVDGARWRPFTLWVTPFVYSCPERVEPALSAEVADVVWVPLSYLADAKNVQPYRAPTGPAELVSPSFQYRSYTIWGMTYRILASFFQLLDIPLPPE
jgi:8-oxo-dGTP pyrophosphatase MutT (NUDIX family)